MLSSNPAKNWWHFKQRIELLPTDRTCRWVNGPPENSLAPLYGHTQCPGGIQYASMEDASYEKVISQFKAYCTLKNNETHQRYIFRMRMQDNSKAPEQSLFDLQLKLKSYRFVQFTDSLLRSQILYGFADRKLQQQLLCEQDLSLVQAAVICQAD